MQPPSRTQLQEAFKLALSMVLMYWLALAMDWDLPKYGALAIAVISLDTAGASISKGLLRIVGTTVGLLTALVGVALFAQDRWLMLGYLCANLLVVAYFIPVSRHGYAWFVAGFMPGVVWSSTYQAVDNAFHFAVFRYLETTAGVVIYSLISVILWPRTAGAALSTKGAELWAGERELFSRHIEMIRSGAPASDLAQMRGKLAAARAAFGATLGQARTDTYAVRSRRHLWRQMAGQASATADAIELWSESIPDAMRLDLSQFEPALSRALERVDRRFERISSLWAHTLNDTTAPMADDVELLRTADFRVATEAARPLDHYQRAALLGFCRELETVDRCSRDLLVCVQALTGIEKRVDTQPVAKRDGETRSPLWDPMRFRAALLPPLSLVLAFLFWIRFDPPTGPSAANFAAIIGLLLVLMPLRAQMLLPRFVLVVLLVVAPIYFLLMPLFENGVELLTLIFIYFFLFSLVGKRLPLIKLLGVTLFAVLIPISNDQSYHFAQIADSTFMLIIGIGVPAIIQPFFSPGRPELAMLREMRVIFQSASEIIGAYSGPQPAKARRHHRVWLFKTRTQPAVSRLASIASRLGKSAPPGATRECLSRLVQAIQSLSLRLRALEGASTAYLTSAGAANAPTHLTRDLAAYVRGVLDQCAKLESTERFDEQNGLERLAVAMKEELDELAASTEAGPATDQMFTALYALLGCARGVTHAATECRDAMSEIHWNTWTESRF